METVVRVAWTPLPLQHISLSITRLHRNKRPTPVECRTHKERAECSSNRRWALRRLGDAPDVNAPSLEWIEANYFTSLGRCCCCERDRDWQTLTRARSLHANDECFSAFFLFFSFYRRNSWESRKTSQNLAVLLQVSSLSIWTAIVRQVCWRAPFFLIAGLFTPRGRERFQSSLGEREHNRYEKNDSLDFQRVIRNSKYLLLRPFAWRV